MRKLRTRSARHHAPASFGFLVKIRAECNSDTCVGVSSEVQTNDACTVKVPKGLRPQHCQHQHPSLCLCLHVPCIIHLPRHFSSTGVPPPPFTPQFPSGQPPSAGYTVPFPGYPPAPANMSSAWVPTAVPTAHSNATPTTHTHLLCLERGFTENNGDLKSSKYLAQWHCVVFHFCISVAYQTAVTPKCI